MLAPDTTRAQGPEEAQYVGERECGACHRGLTRDYRESNHSHALQSVTEAKELILGDFSQGEVIREVQFPGESSPRAFTADDIVYAIGAGRYAQRYVARVEAGDNALVVLPAEWNTVAGEWESFSLAESWPDPAYDFGPNCAGCHTVGLDVATYEWIDDGVMCEACHGPGSNHVALADEGGIRLNDEESTAIREAIYFQPDPQVCGQCHNSGAAPDGHPYPVDYQPGDNLLDPEVFALHDSADPAYWLPSGHGRETTMQFNEWLETAHATALTTAQGSASIQDECLVCHSTDYNFNTRLIADFAKDYYGGEPPAPLTAETASLGVACSTCHNPHTEENDNSFLRDEPDALCTSCHTNTTLFDSGIHHPVMEMFEGLTLIDSVEGTPSVHFAAEDGPDCLTCHMTRLPAGVASHALMPLLPGEVEDGMQDTCSACHTGLLATDLQYLIEDIKADTRNRLTFARTRLGSLSMPDEGTEARAQYDQMLRALDFVQGDGSMGVHNFAYADALLTFAERALSELSVPGASIQPTEAPAPTATPSAPETPQQHTEAHAKGGFRPVTGLVIAIVLLILLNGAIILYRRSHKRGA